MHTTRKKNVALFACRDVCGSNASCPWLLSPSAGITGVLLSFLMSYERSAHYYNRPALVQFTFLSAL